MRKSARAEHRDHCDNETFETETAPANSGEASLEQITINAILEHRLRVSEVEKMDDRLSEAGANSTIDPTDIERLNAHRNHLLNELTAHQLALNNLIDRLGYIPTLPLDANRLN